MANIREILAKNLREQRRKCGLSQPKLAELANLSTHYIAMIEISKKFPSSEVMERLAAALGIETWEFFSPQIPPESALNKLHTDILADLDKFYKTVVSDLEKAVETAVNKAIDKKLKIKK